MLSEFKIKRIFNLILVLVITSVLLIGCDGTTQTDKLPTDGDNITDTSPTPNSNTDVLRPLEIIQHPQNVTVGVGEQATFTVKASGGMEPYTYKWYCDSNTEGIIPLLPTQSDGETTDTLTIYMLSQENSEGFWCAVTDATGTTEVTYKANLTVLPNLKFNLQPKNTNVTEGENAELRVFASGGTTPYTYLWYRSEDPTKLDGQPMSLEVYEGGTTDCLVFIGADSAYTDAYWCEVTDAEGRKITSDHAALTVISPLKILIQPKTTYAEHGKNVTFSVNVTGGTPPYTYTWQLQNSNGYYWDDIKPDNAFVDYSYVADIIGNSLILKADRNSRFASRRMRCVIKDALGQIATSDSFKMDVSKKLQITQQPKSVTVDEYSEAVIRLDVADGKAPYKYEWHKKTLETANMDTVMTEVSNESNLVYFQYSETHDSGEYWCVVSDAEGTVIESKHVYLTVDDVPMYIYNQPKNITVNAGETICTQVDVSNGDPPIQYHWKCKTKGTKNLEADVAGHTKDSFVLYIEKATENDEGEYWCEIKDRGGTMLKTDVIKVTVNNKPLKITQQPTAKVVNITEKNGGLNRIVKGLQITVETEGGAEPVTYDWQVAADGKTWKVLANTSGKVIRNGNKLTISAKGFRGIEGSSLRCVIGDSENKIVTSETLVLSESSKNIIVKQFVADEISVEQRKKNL